MTNQHPPSGELTVLRRRALIEQGIAVIDIGKIRNRDWMHAEWLRQEAKRQLGLELGESR